jgi:hypothetical protein
MRLADKEWKMEANKVNEILSEMRAAYPAATFGVKNVYDPDADSNSDACCFWSDAPLEEAYPTFAECRRTFGKRLRELGSCLIFHKAGGSDASVPPYMLHDARLNDAAWDELTEAVKAAKPLIDPVPQPTSVKYVFEENSCVSKEESKVVRSK